MWGGGSRGGLAAAGCAAFSRRGVADVEYLGHVAEEDVAYDCRAQQDDDLEAFQVLHLDP